MSSRSTGELPILLGVAVIALPVAVFAALFLFALGPTAWLVTAAFLIGTGLVLRGTDADRTEAGLEKTTCAACGAQTELARETCSYREEPL